MTTITRDDLKSDPQRVLDLARRPGGVEVTNADGTHAFRLSIPSEPLPIEHCPGCRCKKRKAKR